MRPDQEWLRDIQHNTDLVISFISSTNREEFLKDEMRSLAAAKAIENIGEAVKHISQELKARYPDVDWVGPARMRDRTALWILVRKLQYRLGHGHSGDTCVTETNCSNSGARV